jgi:hypothetical protein
MRAAFFCRSRVAGNPQSGKEQPPFSLPTAAPGAARGGGRSCPRHARRAADRAPEKLRANPFMIGQRFLRNTAPVFDARTGADDRLARELVARGSGRPLQERIASGFKRALRRRSRSVLDTGQLDLGFRIVALQPPAFPFTLATSSPFFLPESRLPFASPIPRLFFVTRLIPISTPITGGRALGRFAISFTFVMGDR